MKNRLKLAFLFITTLIANADLHADVPTGGKNQWRVSPESNLEPREALKQQVRALAVQSDFIHLEELRLKLFREQQRFEDGEPRLVVFYEALQDCGPQDTDCSLFLQRWKNTSQEDGAPYTIEAQLKLQQAWKIRGTGYVGQKAEETLLQSVDKLKEAAKAIQVAQKKANPDPQLFDTLVEVVAMLGAPDDVVDDLFKRGQAIDPLYFPLYRTRANFLRPEWGGEPGQVETFAERAAEATKGRVGNGLYSIIAVSVENYSRDTFFKKYKFSWERMKKGLDDLSKTFPKTHVFTRDKLDLSFSANDRKAVLDELALHDGKLDPRIVKEGPAGMQTLVDWARGKADFKRPALHEAVSAGDRAKVEELLQKKANVNQTAPDGSTPLIVATLEHRELVPLLLKYHASPVTGDYHGKLPLELAVKGGDRKTAQLLLEAGGFTPSALRAAVREDNLDMVKDMLSLAKNPEVSDSEENPFRMAVDNDRFEAAKILLQDKRFEKSLKNWKEPPLHYAVRKGKAGFVKLFLEANLDPNVVVPGSGTAFDIARSEHPELLGLLQEKNKDDSEKLRIATAAVIPSGYRLRASQQRVPEDAVGDIWVKMKLDGKWAELLEEYKKTLSVPNERTDAKSKQEIFYVYAGFCPDALELCTKQCESWSSAFPQSAIPLTAQLQVEWEKLSHFHPLDKESEGPEKNARVRKELAQKGWDLFQKARQLPDADAQTFTHGIAFASASGKNVATIEEILTSGKKKRADYWPLWRAAVLALVEKKDREGLLKVTSEAVQATEEKLGKGYYARIASLVENVLQDTRATDSLFTWDLVKTGYADLSKSQPGEKFFSVGYFLMATRRMDREATRQALAQLGNTYPEEFGQLTGRGRGDFERLALLASVDGSGKRPLVEAVMKGDRQGVLRALENGSLVSEADEKGRRALTLAINNHPELVPLLIEKGARPGWNGVGSETDPELIIHKNQLENLQALLNSDFEANTTSQNGSLLSVAILEKNKEAAKIILACPRFQPGTAGIPGKSEIDLAIQLKQHEILRAIATAPTFHINSSLPVAGTKKPFNPSLPLSRAILARDHEAVKILLAAGADPSRGDTSEKTPFDLAKESNDPSLVAMLVDPKLLIQGTVKGEIELLPLLPEEMPIIEAVKKGDAVAVEAAVRARYAQPDPRNMSQPLAQSQGVQLDPAKGYSAIHVAVSRKRPDLVTILLKYGGYASVFGYTNPEFMSPLLVATRVDDTESARVLLARGDRLDSKYKSGETPYLHAKLENKQELLELFSTYARAQNLTINGLGQLMEDPEVGARSKAENLALDEFLKQNGLSQLDAMQGKALEKAISTHQHEMVRFLATRYATRLNGAGLPSGSTLPLTLAIQSGDPMTVHILLDAGAYPRGKWNGQESPLEVARKSGAQSLIPVLEDATFVIKSEDNLNVMDSDASLAVTKDNYAALQTILKNPRNINPQDGMTALHYAVKYNKPKAVELLLQSENYRKSEFLNSASNKSPSLLYMVVANGNAEILKMLLAAGMTPEYAAFGGESPIAYVQRKNLRELLEPMEAALQANHKKLGPDGLVVPDLSGS